MYKWSIVGNSLLFFLLALVIRLLGSGYSYTSFFFFFTDNGYKFIIAIFINHRSCVHLNYWTVLEFVLNFSWNNERDFLTQNVVQFGDWYR